MEKELQKLHFFTSGQVATMLLVVVVTFIATYLITSIVARAIVVSFAMWALCVGGFILIDALKTEAEARRIEERQLSRQRPRHRMRTSSRRG